MYNDQVPKTYIGNDLNHLFVHVDLNDLVERDILPFWTLLLTRIVDSVQKSSMPEKIKRTCRHLFVQSIQLKDLFFTIDSVQKVLHEVINAHYYPTLFLIRFDRLRDAVTPEFFSNILGLRDAVNKKVSFVFTSDRSLPDLAPDVFKKPHVSVLARDMYLKPATDEDMSVILSTLGEQYHVELSDNMKKWLIELAGGYVQYLQLSLIKLGEFEEQAQKPSTKDALSTVLLSDEQIAFQSEELLESLTVDERNALQMVIGGSAVSDEQRTKAAYVWNTGIVSARSGKDHIFSPLFSHALTKAPNTHATPKTEFTKKEHLLFTFLKHHEGILCERDAIIEAVWPENKDFGISDWAIDRLVARLRAKLKAQASPYQIVTVVTRGYKLVRV